MADRLEDEIQRYIADLALQKYEQAENLKECKTYGELVDYMVTLGSYRTAADILGVIMKIRLDRTYDWRTHIIKYSKDEDLNI